MELRARGAAGLSIVLPGLGQMARGRVGDGLVVGLTTLFLYAFALLVWNQHSGFLWGDLLTVPVNWRPSRVPPHDAALIGLALLMHGLAVWDAARRAEDLERG